MKRIACILKSVGLWLLWALALFAQHVSCFDVFETNFLYLWLIAILAAALHYTLLVLFRGQNLLLLVCYGFYFVMTVGKLFALVEMIRFQNQIGLTLLCFLLDAGGLMTAGMLLSSRRRKEQSRHE